jgi:hypothetical protein
MAEYVKDAILMNEFRDLVLIRLIDLTVTAERTGRPLFSTLLEEPVFFRKYFQVWIREALEERDRLASAQAENGDLF